MANSSVVLGTLLGAGSAEADTSMLARAFLETPDYQALRHTSDFNFVVGRRGTGKSALFQKLKEDFSSDESLILLCEQPEDYEMLELQSLLSGISADYRVLRPITRMLWTAHFLWETSIAVAAHYRFSKSPQAAALLTYISERADKKVTGITFAIRALRSVLSNATPAEIPRLLVEKYGIGELTDTLRQVLEFTGARVVAMYDRLDEAWTPEVGPVSILGGLARAAAEYREKRFPIYQIVFIRDNMFRALAQLDDDFTRHIEGHSLRLHWDEDSLFHLVVARLRVALATDNENPSKIWNRFAQRELHDRSGFARCLKYTLYRPRDILVLLNEAYLNAQRDGRDVLIEKDIEKSAIRTSQTRLEDLCKEYDKVLPGVRLFVSSFQGQKAQRPVADVVSQLDEIAATNDYSAVQSRDLVLFESGGEMLSALYSVGFIGVRDELTAAYVFCHDGASTALVSLAATHSTLVHPCYWKALDVAIVDESADIAIQVNDDYEVPPTDAPIALRLQRLGRLPEELSGIPEGHPGSRNFEGWVLRAIRLLFSGPLQNIEFKPNPADALNQRDVVARNDGKTSFWQRLHQDYQVRQVVFECKNYVELKPEDFRQIGDYLSGEYGRLAIAVRRGSTDSISELEKDRIRAMFAEHKKLVLVLPVSMLVLCIRKLRTPKKYDYAEYTMSKHMDHLVRSVLGLRHHRPFKKRRLKKG